jgi:hypothetical protein
VFSLTGGNIEEEVWAAPAFVAGAALLYARSARHSRQITLELDGHSAVF